MKRRTYLKTMLAASAVSSAVQAADASHPIQLHVDMTVASGERKGDAEEF